MIISLHIGSLLVCYIAIIMITSDIWECGKVFVIIYFVRVPTDYRQYKVQNIRENKMYSIIVNYDPSIQNK